MFRQSVRQSDAGESTAESAPKDTVSLLEALAETRTTSTSERGEDFFYCGNISDNRYLSLFLSLSFVVPWLLV